MADLPETEGLNLVELLDLLRPIPDPEPVSMVPATQGWIWLALIALIALVFAVRAYVRHRRSNAYRRAALSELERCEGDPARIAPILRRTALVAYPRRKVASLVGEAWLQFLNETCPGASFTGEAVTSLTQAPYRGGQSNPDLLQHSRHWIRKHRKGGKK